MKGNISFLIFFLLIAICVAAIVVFVYENFLLKENTRTLENEVSRTTGDFARSTKKLVGEIKALQADLDSTKEQLATTTVAMYDFEAKYNYEKSRMDAFDSQVNAIQETTGTLEKLSQTDKELLKRYSKVYFLNENYVPKSLAKIDPAYTINPKEDYLFNSQTLSFLNALMSEAQTDGVDIKIVSAYRSFGEQSSLKSSYKMVYGSGANQFSADQGYSEHQLGTTVDFTTSKIGSNFTDFEKTPTYRWLLDNAYMYGFAISYQKDNKFYQFEPWHWRFIGRALAQKLHNDGKNFYDLSQREVDQYLVSFFD